jgi:hydroxyacylglutathione hydrolase
LRFALAVEPSNLALQARADEVTQLRAAGKMSLPSTIALELATNPFLRSEQNAVFAAAQRHKPAVQTPAQAFAALREWKNHF